MKRAVVTGPTGAVGLALVNKLLNQEYDVLAIVRPGSKRKKYLPSHRNLKILECQLSNMPEISSQIVDEYDTFYHLGWISSSSRNDIVHQVENINLSLAAVDLAKNIGCNTFIGAGSQAEYGRVEQKMHADTPAFPENAYGAAKLCAGQITRLQCLQYGMRHIWTRILSVYGPGDAERSIVPYVIRCLLNHESPCLTEGRQIWNLIFSEDCAKALWLLDQYGENNKIYCIGSERSCALREYVNRIRDWIAPGQELGYGMKEYAQNEVMNLQVDLSDLMKDTGYCPDFSFKEGIMKTIQWYREHP